MNAFEIIFFLRHPVKHMISLGRLHVSGQKNNISFQVFHLVSNTKLLVVVGNCLVEHQADCIPVAGAREEQKIQINTGHKKSP